MDLAFNKTSIEDSSRVEVTYNVASLRSPNAPAYTQLPENSRVNNNDKNAGLRALKLSHDNEVNHLFWEWLHHPSKDESEITIRHECVEEFSKMGADLPILIESLEDHLQFISGRAIWLGGYDKGSEIYPPPPNVERVLKEESGSQGARTLISSLYQRVEALREMLEELKISANPITQSAISEIRVQLDNIPKLTDESIDEAFQGETLVIVAARIYDLFEAFISWSDELSKQAIPLRTLMYIAKLVQSDNFCTVHFSNGSALDRSESYQGLWNLALEPGPVSEQGAALSRQTRNDSTEDAPVTLLKGSTMGGKSFFLRSRLLLSLFAQTFKYAPAKEATLNLYDSIHYNERGRTRSDRNLSSFGSSAAKVVKDFENLGSRALFIGDELLSETDESGEAKLVVGTLRTLAEAGAKVYVATHSEIAVAALESETWAKVYHFPVEVHADGAVVFSHKLARGPDSAHAMEVARALNAPALILEYADDFLSGKPVSIEPPPRFNTPHIAAWDSQWRGLGYFLPASSKSSHENGLPGQHYSTSPNVFNRIIDFEFVRGSFQSRYSEETIEGLKWSNPHPEDAVSLSLFLTADRDFTGTNRLNEGDPFYRHYRIPYLALSPGDLAQSFYSRKKRLLSSDELLPGGRACSIADIYSRQALLNKFENDGLAEKLEAAAQFLINAHSQWPILLMALSESDTKEYLSPRENFPGWILESVSHYPSRNLGPGTFNWAREALIGMDAARECLNRLPQSEQLEDVMRHFGVIERAVTKGLEINDRRMALLDDNLKDTPRDKKPTRLSQKDFDTTWARFERHAEKLDDWMVRYLKSFGEDLSSEESSEYCKKDKYAWWCALGFLANKVKALETSDVSLLNPRPDVTDDLLTIFRECLGRAINLPNSLGDVEGLLRTACNHLTKEDIRGNFITCLEAIDHPQAWSAARYYEDILDFFFGPYRTPEDLRKGRAELQKKKGNDKWFRGDVFSGAQFSELDTRVLRTVLSQAVLVSRLAQHSRDFEYCDAHIGDSYAIEFSRLYHPEREKESYTPQTLKLDDDTRLFILSGPNMSGKSMLLKAITGMVLSARNTGKAAADKAVIPPYSKVVYMDRVADTTDQGLSAFGTDVSNATMLCDFVGIDGVQAHPAIVVLNEPFSSVTARDKSAQTYGLVKSLIEAGHFVIYEGHDHSWVSRMINECSNCTRVAHLSYELDKNAKEGISFHYDIVEDAQAPSLAIPVARALGMPQSVIDYAEGFDSDQFRSS